jgi:glycosyltransferase involved in cell wall biosynthesis
MERRNKIKLLVIIPSLVTGGAEILTVYLLRHLDRNKFEVALCLFEEKGDLRKRVPSDVKLFVLGKKNRWGFFRLPSKLNKLVSEYKPDIIYTRMWYATSVATVSRRLYSYRIPIVANEEHNHKRDILPFDLFGIVKKYFMDWSHKKADIVIVPSKGVKNDLLNSYKLREEKIKVIYNSVDLELIRESILVYGQASPELFTDDIPTIAAFGRLIKRKGFEDLLRAFRLVLDRVDARLILIGDGEERLNLQKLGNGLGINGSVRFLGYQENPFGIISSSDLFILSSRWEGFGNVIIEAMACGVPVISTDCPFGPNEIITDGVNGLLVPVGDVEAMADAILALLQDNALRSRLAEAGRKRAEEFSVDKMVTEYEIMFEDKAS